MAIRNRILYQSEALYVSDLTAAAGVANTAQQLNRVQDISHDLDINRTDIYEFGRLAPLTRQVVDAPTVSLDFSYLLADGDNEVKMGFELQNSSDGGSAAWPSAISGIVSVAAEKEKNYYVVTTKEYLDADDGAVGAGTGPTAADCTVVGFGNGVITNYGVNVAVGDLPTASLSVEAYNCKFQQGIASASQWISGQAPTIIQDASSAKGHLKDNYFELPHATTGSLEVFSLRPGDVSVAFGVGSIDSTQANKLQIGGAILPTGDPDSASMPDGETPIHLQNFSIEVPLARTPLNQIGSTFAYDRAIDFPLDMTFNMSAFLADVSAGQLIDLMCETQDTREITVDCRFPCGKSDDASATTTNIQYVIKNAYLQSQNFGATIGDNKTVDLSFTAQFGGLTDTNNGLFISGISNAS